MLGELDIGVEEGPGTQPPATVVSMRKPSEGWKEGCCIPHASCGCGAKMAVCWSTYAFESGSQDSMGDGAAQVPKENESKPLQDGRWLANAFTKIRTHHLRVRGRRRIPVGIRERRGRSAVLAAR